MTALCGIVERIPSLAVVATRSSGRLAHLLLAVRREVDLVHGGSRVAQRLRGGRLRVLLAALDRAGGSESSD